MTAKRILKRMWNTLMVFLILVLFILIIGIIACYMRYKMVYEDYVNEIVDNMCPADFEWPSSQTIYFSNGEEMMMYAPYQKETIEYPTTLLKEVTTAAEDERFYEHNGIDLKAIARSFVSNMNSDSTQGASTITQQLVKLSYLSSEKTYDRKIKEALIAMNVEKRFTKDEILTFYLNKVYFANGIYGIADASQYYFSKPYTELTYDEAASLIAIVNSPTKLDPVDHPSANKSRRDRILSILNMNTSVSTEFNVNDAYNNIYSYDENVTGAISYVHSLIENNDELKNKAKIETTIDYDLQYYVEDLVDQLKDPLEAAVVVIDNETGKVIAIDGAKTSEDTSMFGLNRAFQSPRQTGSSIKPLLDYGVIFDNYDVDTDLLVYDKGGKGIPKNSGGGHRGRLTIKQAVTNSVNTIAYRLYSFMLDDGIEPLTYLEKMGFSHIVEQDYKAKAVSIGGFTYGATALEMAGGYATLANYGMYREPTAIADVNNEEVEVYSSIAAYLMTDAMSEVATKGTAKKLNPGVPISCKTGTTNDYKDAWLCGYTADYTIAIWVGADNNKESYSVKSSGEVLQMFKSILKQLDLSGEEIYPENYGDMAWDEVYYRRDPEKLEKYFKDMMPAQPVTPVVPEVPVEQPVVPTEPIIQIVVPDTPQVDVPAQ